jgi:hypothetical protein
MKNAAKNCSYRLLQVTNKHFGREDPAINISSRGGLMETKKHWKIVSAGIWIAGFTVAMLASLVHSRDREPEP